MCTVWMVDFPNFRNTCNFDKIPKNPYTNEYMNKYDRMKCFKKVLNYYTKCKRSNNNL